MRAWVTLEMKASKQPCVLPKMLQLGQWLLEMYASVFATCMVIGVALMLVSVFVFFLATTSCIHDTCIPTVG